MSSSRQVTTTPPLPGGTLVSALNTALANVGGGAVASLASGATVDLGSTGSMNIDVTGGTTITSFGANANLLVGEYKAVRFVAGLTITFNATSMITPSGTDMTVVANDLIFVRYQGSGNWRILGKVPAAGATAALSAAEISLASAATVNIGGAGSQFIEITGVAAITAFDNVQAGVWRFVRFSGVLTLTHNAVSLIIPGGASKTTAVGDAMLALSLGSGNWRVYAYWPASAAVPRNDGGYINKFRNGTFGVWQRGTSSISVTTAGLYACDGWAVVPVGATVTANRQANSRTGALTEYGLQIVGAASVTDVLVRQKIEGQDAAALEGQSVTFQMQVNNGTGGSITPTITVKHANAFDNFGAMTTDVNAQNLQQCANGAWTQISYTFTASASAGNGLEVTVDFGNNFSSNAKSVILAEADIRVGSTVQTPEMRSLQAEIDQCHRHYRTSYGNGVAPGTNTRNGGVFTCTNNGSQIVAYGNIDYDVEMRATPTLSFWDLAGNASKVSYNDLTGNLTWTDNGAPGASTAFNADTLHHNWNMFVGSTAGNFFVQYAATAEFPV